MLNRIDIYEKLINYIDEILIVVDSDYNIIFANSNIKHLSADWENVIGSKCFLSLFNNIKPCNNCQIEKLKKNETTKNIYHETIDRRGINCILSASFERIDNNIFTEIIRDVTEEKQLVNKLVFQTKQLKANNVIMKRTLMDSKNKSDFLSKILNSMPEGVMVVSKNLKIIEINTFMIKNFSPNKLISSGDDCYKIYGKSSQCKDCYFIKRNNRSYRKYDSKDFTVFFNEFDDFLVETLIDTTRFIKLVNEIKAKQEELNLKQHQMTLLNKDLIQLNNKLQSAQQVIEDEIKQVRLIQKSLLPSKLPEIKNFSFGATYIPTEDVGGDYYDYIEMSNDFYGFLVADVSGHGIPAAVIMAITRALVHSYTIDIVSSSEVMNMINEILCDNIYTNDFVTMFYIVINMKTGICNYASAGHHPVLYFDKSKLVVHQLKARGLFLGTFKKIEFEEKELVLDNGDILLLYTDGLVDVQNRSDKFYGIDRLISKLILFNEMNPQEIVSHILEDVKEFSEGRPYFDDLTMLIIKKEEINDKDKS
jgi:sigma-B regulation protein RsbU (phosphoserine phosphatase)